MTALKHPRISNVEVDVPESDVARWVAQGWLRDDTAIPDEDIAFDGGGFLPPAASRVAKPRKG